MKYAITSMGESADSRVDVHFARCSYFALFDSDDSSLEFVKNPFKDMPEKAGQSAVKFLNERGVEIVISCEFGEKVKNHFNSMNMGMIILDSIDMKIDNIVKILKNKHKR
ncbi:MAG: NifB/NifX family molybdenum-iron cluster-binding protein [Bacteroidales bacterium]